MAIATTATHQAMQISMDKREGAEVVCEELFNLFCDVFAPVVKPGALDIFMEVTRLALLHRASLKDEQNERVH